jgi:hypothetical protein
MSSAANVISYLKLDDEYDPIFLTSASLTNLAAVEQIIKTTILLFMGEWWEDLNTGTPMFQKIIGQRATPAGLQIMSQALSARISGVPYVSAVQSVEASFNPITRKFNFSATADTSFGVADVSFEVGSVAGLQG